MLPPKLYSRENVERLKYAQFAAVGLVALTCGYLLIKTLLGLQTIWSAERMLRHAKIEASRLSREVSAKRRIEAGYPLPGGGVDKLAVRLAEWASERRIRIESVVPEGAGSATEISVDGSKLGVWNSSKVRVKGQGNYAELMSFLDELRNPPLPVRLDSFALQSTYADGAVAISFDLVLTVYEKKGGSG